MLAIRATLGWHTMFSVSLFWRLKFFYAKLESIIRNPNVC